MRLHDQDQAAWDALVIATRANTSGMDDAFRTFATDQDAMTLLDLMRRLGLDPSRDEHRRAVVAGLIFATWGAHSVAEQECERNGCENEVGHFRVHVTPLASAVLAIEQLGWMR